MWSDSDAAALEKSLSPATNTSATERQSSASGSVAGSFKRITVCPDEKKKKNKQRKKKEMSAALRNEFVRKHVICFVLGTSTIHVQDKWQL